MLRIIIPGEPFAQPRQRHGVLRRRDGSLVTREDGTPIVHNYQPTKAVNWKATAQAHYRDAVGAGSPLAGPVGILVTCYFTCPKSDWRTRTPRDRRWHTKTPDADNVIKAVKDSAKGVLWLDDCQVADERTVKIIAAQGEAPRVELDVWSIEELPPQRDWPAPVVAKDAPQPSLFGAPRA